ncbi:MAG: type II toxin-antitoxin system HicA family toxin [Verrucomicrobia subdivision 3 bacterium]|nr:type II toxin-antitoxin system HicA family toxin [Limisphaerales bacterium]
MKLPRNLSGSELVKALCKHYDYQRVHQEGSHIILQTETPKHHRISIPNHPSLRPGTLNAILKAVAQAKAVGKDEIVQKL